MADLTANPPKGVLSASREGAPTWGSLAGTLGGAARPQGQRPVADRRPPDRRPPDRIPPRVTADEAPEEVDWGADPVFGATSASAALAGFNATESRRFQGARRGLFLGGGVLSLALVGLIGVWGYKVVLREVLGVPVVAAEAGPMRVLPENPGGIITADGGLAVNAVAADGTAAPPSDVLTLAPPTSDLAPEDMEVAQTDAEAGEVQPRDAAPENAPVEAAAAAIAAAPVVEAALPGEEAPRQATLTAALLPADHAMTPEEVLAFADSISAGAAPLAPAEEAAPEAAPAVERLSADVPGVAEAVRPPARPASSAPSAAPVGEVEGVTLTSAEVPAAEEPEAVALTGAIPAGTSLVQLGAFDSPEVAASEWERLQGPFGEFLGEKERVIQEAESGGRTFFRLRAMGFEDLADARRLCAALVAEDAGCIPVVVQ